MWFVDYIISSDFRQNHFLTEKEAKNFVSFMGTKYKRMSFEIYFVASFKERDCFCSNHSKKDLDSWANKYE